jgi:signal transduction histidine kinase
MLQRDSDVPLSERQRKMIDEAAKSCGRIVELINEMSDLSKLDSGMAAVNTEAFDLFSVVQEVARDVHEGEDRNVQLLVAGESAGAVLTGDLIRIRRALAALFRAIVREQPASSTVVADRRVTTSDGASHALIVVAPEQDVQMTYAAAAAPFDYKRGGLGLALPLARRVVERHGGRIWSPSVEGGATVRALVVSFPLPELNR